jgi:hypothetical protein
MIQREGRGRSDKESTIEGETNEERERGKERPERTLRRKNGELNASVQSDRERERWRGGGSAEGTS